MTILLIIVALVILAFGVLQLPLAKGYRTIIYNALVGAIPVTLDILSYLQAIDLSLYLPPNYVPWVMLGMALGNILLRYHTTTAVGQK